MSTLINTYLSDVHNRNRVMAIFQFLPMTIQVSVQQAGYTQLAESLGNLSSMADSYRAVTRLMLCFHAYAPETLSKLAKPQEDRVAWRLEQLTHAFHMVFCVNEFTGILARRGVFSSDLMRIGRIAVLCWLYTLSLNLVRNVHLLLRNRAGNKSAGVVPYTPAQRRRGFVQVIKFTSYIVFGLTCLPEGKPQLLLDVSGPLVPLHRLIQAMAPNPLHLSQTMRGLAGLTAAVCELY